jgi:TonB-dependent receptor
VLAAYVKFDWGLDVLGRPLTGNVGLREVQTRLHGEAYGTDPVSGDPLLQAKDSTRYNLLPSFNAKLGLTDELFLRLGASKTLGQVNFQYLSSATVISNPVQRDAQQGNPSLKPYTSTNYDLSLEDYFGRHGLVYVGLFHKRVDGFIQTVAVQEQINGQTYNVSTYQSSGLSTIRGVEVGFQKFFDELPKPLDGLGIQANYTFVDSQAPSAIAGQTVPLEGLSKNSYNLVGMYERNRVSARLAYNYRSSYVVSTSSSGAQGVPIVAAALGTLDFSLAYNVTEHLSLVLDGVNILNANTEQYYGNPHNQMNYLPLNSRYGLQAKYVF